MIEIRIPTPVPTPTSKRKTAKEADNDKDQSTTTSKTSNALSKKGSKVSDKSSAPQAPQASRRVVEASSPQTLSRAGRSNSPRIDYKTGQRITSQQTEQVSTSGSAATRKRGKVKTTDSARSSATSSPVPKKNLVEDDSTSGSDFVESTPPASRKKR